MDAKYRFATRCVRTEDADAYGAARPPIYQSTTFAASADAEARYTRYGNNPTLHSVERQLASIEQADSALIFASGMAAISAACLALGRGGVIALGNAYGGTLDLLTEQLPRLGIATTLLAPGEEDRVDDLAGQGYGLVLTESPTNPDLAVQDLGALAERVHRHGARLMVDNTFATPVNQQPLTLGADLVVHSATKFLGGHSDLTAGAAMGAADAMAELAVWRRQLGQTPAPETAALLSRSIATLEIRVERQNASALKIAQHFEGHRALARVHYPGLPTAPGHACAVRQMSGFGGMMALEVQGGEAAAAAAVERLRLFLNAPSLGGVESLATQPARTSHADMSPTERRERGIADGLIRLSIGLEDPEDLIEDLEQALGSQ